MDWSTVAGLLLKYGPELVDYIVKLTQGGGPVTVEEWAKLKALTEVSPRQQLLAAAKRAGLSETDPKVVALLAMTPE